MVEVRSHVMPNRFLSTSARQRFEISLAFSRSRSHGRRWARRAIAYRDMSDQEMSYRSDRPRCQCTRSSRAPSRSCDFGRNGVALGRFETEQRVVQLCVEIDVVNDITDRRPIRPFFSDRIIAGTVIVGIIDVGARNLLPGRVVSSPCQSKDQCSNGVRLIRQRFGRR